MSLMSFTAGVCNEVRKGAAAVCLFGRVALLLCDIDYAAQTSQQQIRVYRLNWFLSVGVKNRG